MWQQSHTRSTERNRYARELENEHQENSSYKVRLHQSYDPKLMTPDNKLDVESLNAKKRKKEKPSTQNSSHTSHLTVERDQPIR